MIQSILNIIQGIGEGFTIFFNIIEAIYKGMLDIPKLLNFAFGNANYALSFAIPAIILPSILIILIVVVIYKIFGRT